MKPFIHEDYLLVTETARRLYHEYAEQMPVIDYHCHLSPKEISEDRRWDNMTQLWLGGDHYKWRQMRANGVAEVYCTGNASDYDKFLKYAETMDYLLRSPLFDWTQLELARYFGVYDLDEGRQFRYAGFKHERIRLEGENRLVTFVHQPVCIIKVARIYPFAHHVHNLLFVEDNGVVVRAVGEGHEQKVAVVGGACLRVLCDEFVIQSIFGLLEILESFLLA